LYQWIEVPFMKMRDKQRSWFIPWKSSKSYCFAYLFPCLVM
jgi:hypothetical protein